MKTHIFSVCLCLCMLPVVTVACHQDLADDMPAGDAGAPVIATTLSNLRVNAFAEDTRGYIWMATSRGLNRYDGHDYYQYFKNSDSTGLASNMVQDLLCDSRGRLWVATNNGLCRYTEQDNFVSIPPANPYTPYGKQVLEDRKGNIYLDTGPELSRYNEATGRMETVIPDFPQEFVYYHTRCCIDGNNKLWVVTPLYLKSYELDTYRQVDSIPLRGAPQSCYLHPNGELWMAGGGNISLFDTNSLSSKPLPDALARCRDFEGVEITCIYPYSNHQLMFATLKDGLFCYDSVKKAVIHQDEEGFPMGNPPRGIISMFTDSRGNFWQGTDIRGYAVHYHNRGRFNNHFLYSFFREKPVISLSLEQGRYLWVATYTDGIYRCDLQMREIEQVKIEHLPWVKQRQSIAVRTLLVDSKGRVWLVPDGINNALICCRYEAGRLVEDRVYRLQHPPMTLSEGYDHTIWVGSYGPGVYAQALGKEDFTYIRMFKDVFGFSPGLLPRPDGRLVVSAFNHPFTEVSLEKKAVREDTVCWQGDEPGGRAFSFIPSTIYCDTQSNYWIGTMGNGLVHYTPADGRLYPIPGVPCTDISSIEEDKQGNLWVSTQYGLGKYNPQTDTFTNYYEADGIGGNQFYDRASCRLPDGTLVFGGTHGLTVFNPDGLYINNDAPLLFEDLKVHNRRIRPGMPDGCIDKHLSYNPDVKLRYDQNSFGISFAALDYSEHERLHYYYKLDGYDADWINMRNSREAYFANLPAGSYVLKVRAANDQEGVEAENSLHITVQPAPWATWWAYAAYVLLVAGIVGLFVRSYRHIRAERAAVLRAEQEKEQEQLVNRMNMNFFANVSHEFRTPLTMIAGPVAQLCDSPDVVGKPKELLRIVQRSVNRMLKLVNQLLDFNKLENDVLKLNVRRQDVVAVLKGQVDMYSESASRKGIDLEADGLEDTFLMWLDEDKLDKIFGNLMSNALKFTPSGGRINVSFDVVGRADVAEPFSLTEQDKGTQYVKVSVANTGKGIPDDQFEKIFERYYQLSGQAGGCYNWGTGIGLYYARRLARLHHGYLKAFQPASGSGAMFAFILPADDVVYAGEERRQEVLLQPEAFPLSEDLSGTDRPEEGKADAGEHKQTILVVDDDAEVVHYLDVLLSKDYRVVCRFDVDAALEAIRKEVPDLVLSDVVMPGKNGFQLCREVKNDLQVCHIPVVLVTAKGATSDMVEGLNAGADSYVTKPFDPAYLQALIKSQVSNREKVRNLLAQSTRTDNFGKGVLSPQDEVFMSELYRVMEEELSNAELDTNRLAESLKISRSKFYYKVKGLTGENPGSFFRTYKLNRAAQLISEGRYTLSEIADMTGFSTPSHFTRCFKKQFGVVPSEYKAPSQSPFSVE